MEHDTVNPNNKKAQETGLGNDPADSSISVSSPELFYSPDITMERGWIKSWRKSRDWEWYKKPGMFHLFHHLIYGANHKDGKWQGIEIKRGQLVSGRNKLALETGLSPQQIRTCLSRLENSGELTIKSTKQYSIITICNYDKYQPSENEINQASNHQSTKHQPTINHKQELKNDKNEKNNNIQSSSDDLFDRFWSAYPKKIGKGYAQRIWVKIKQKSATLDLIMQALEWQKKSDQWTRENGQYIPNPSTYLNQKRWEDERKETDRERERRIFSERYTCRTCGIKTSTVVDGMCWNCKEHGPNWREKFKGIVGEKGAITGQ